MIDEKRICRRVLVLAIKYQIMLEIKKSAKAKAESCERRVESELSSLESELSSLNSTTPLFYGPWLAYSRSPNAQIRSIFLRSTSVSSSSPVTCAPLNLISSFPSFLELETVVTL